MTCAYCGSPIEIITTACPFCGSATLLGERYEIRARIGRGGMGEVFRAYDRRLDTDVALKRLPPQFSTDPQLRESLTREARVMARLSDAAIVRLFDLADFSGFLYLILEYVPGPNLSAMIRSGYRAPAAELARIIGDVCQGLTAAHRIGVIHRDLKPSNLLLSLEGADRAAFESAQRLPVRLGSASVKISDFGLAKAVLESGATFTSEFGGTPGYMAPEQMEGGKPSAETDIFALGVLTCELLTGTLPRSYFENGRRSLPGVPDAVTAVVVQAISPVRTSRYPSAEKYYEALTAALEGRPLPLRRPAIVPAKTSSRTVAILLAIGVAAIGGIGSIAYYTESSRHRAQPTIQLEKQDDGPAIEWHSPPRVTELPPIVEEARGRLPSRGLAGPSKPKIAWRVNLRGITAMHIQTIGVDGTVYLTGLAGVCAVRDGEVLWAFNPGLIGASNLQIAEDGRIWFGGMDGVYCLNRDGKGGRLPASFRAPEQPSERYYCLMNQELSGPGGKLPLDGNCTSGGVTTGPDGAGYVATDSPSITAVSPAGKIAWKVPAPCNANNLLMTLPGQLLFTCQDRIFHALVNGKESWSVRADGQLFSNMAADSSGTLYYGDYGRESGVTHLHALDAKGKDAWMLDTRRMSASSIAIDNRKRLFVVGSFLRSALLCLTD